MANLTLAGLTPTAVGLNLDSAPGDDETFTYSFEIEEGSPAIGVPLSLSFDLVGPGLHNTGVDHVRLTLVPEPIGLGLLAFPLLAARRRDHR